MILTPLPKTSPELIQKATDAWAAIGSHVLRMTPEDHDAAFAAVSHLPHILAFAYFNSVSRQPAGRDYLSLGGPGFRDFTRIAASNPAVWRDILMANREEILKQTRAFAIRSTRWSTSSRPATPRRSRRSSAAPATRAPAGR